MAAQLRDVEALNRGKGIGWASPTRRLERRVGSSLIPGLLAGVPGTVVVLVTEAKGLLRERKACV